MPANYNKHCNCAITKESRAAILIETEQALARIPENERKAAVMAAEQCNYEWRRLNILFLQLEEFNVEATVKRIVSYWKIRLEVFADKAFCPLVLGDNGAFAKEDIIALEAGAHRLFDGNVDNSSGRAIMYSQQRNHRGHSYMDEMSFVRAWWYVLHIAVYDPDIRAHGLIYVVDPRDAKFTRFDPEVVRMMFKALSVFPIALHSIHFCHPGIYFHSLYSTLAAVKVPGVSLHSHVGSVEAVAARLEGFGIPKSSIPFDLGGDLDLESYSKEWLARRRFESQC